MVQHRKTDESCETRELSEDRQSIEQEDILDLADEGGDGEFVLYCHLKVEGGGVNFTLEQAMQVQRGSRGVTLLFY